MSNEGKQSGEQSLIRLENLPHLRGTPGQKKYDEKRADLVPKVKEYVRSNQRFAGQEVTVNFVKKGAGSLVSIIETPKERVVLKVRLDMRPGEAEFLTAWESEGVAVPHVIEDGLVDGHPYTLMDFVDAETLDKHHTLDELVREERYVDMGRLLRVMHRPRAQGYGSPVDGRGEFENFADWLEQSEYVKVRIDYVEKHQLLDTAHGSLAEAKKILVAYVGATQDSSYCHGDLAPSNIFDTEPLTVFDPVPAFNHGYIDLARAIITAAKERDGEFAAEQLKTGYFAGEPYDADVLRASIFLNSYFKLMYVHQQNKPDEAVRIRDYLLQIKQS